MASGVDTVFGELGKMTVLELVELKNKLEEEWGVTAAAPVAVAAPAGGGGDAAAAEEQSAFDVVLTEAGQQKIGVIKVVRAITGLGRDTVYSAIRDGRLVARKFGRRTLITDDDLRQFLAGLPRAGGREDAPK